MSLYINFDSLFISGNVLVIGEQAEIGSANTN